jgi:hypothetical protein
MRTREPTKAFYCLRCDDEWDTDPRIAVPCPHCQAPAGSPCRRPSGHVHSASFAQPHKDRRQLAWATAPCDCLRQWDEAHADAGPNSSPKEPVLVHHFTLFPGD